MPIVTTDPNALGNVDGLPPEADNAAANAPAFSNDPTAHAAVCNGYRPTYAEDGSGGTIFTYALTFSGALASFNAAQSVDEVLTNGAVRTRTHWGKVYFPLDTDILASDRVYDTESGQWFEVEDVLPEHAEASARGPLCRLLHLGPSDDVPT